MSPSQPKTNRTSLKPKFSTQIQNNKNSNLSSKFYRFATEKKLAAALFVGQNQPRLPPASPVVTITNLDVVMSSDLQQFPSMLSLTAAPEYGAGAVSSSTATVQTAANQPNQPAMPSGEPSSTPSIPWADMMDEEMISGEEAAGKNATADPPEK